MKMNSLLRKLVSPFIIVSLSIILITFSSTSTIVSSASSNSDVFDDNVRSYRDIDGNVYNTLPVDTIIKPMTIEEAAEFFNYDSVEELLSYNELQNELEVVTKWFEENKVDIGGIYIDSNETIIVQLAESSSKLMSAENILQFTKDPQKIKIERVKYTEKELQESLNRLDDYVSNGIIGLSMVNTEKNKISIYISEENYNNYRESITKLIDEEMIEWIIENVVVVKYANINPGETISYKSGTERFACSAGFAADYKKKKSLVDQVHNCV